MLKCAYGDIIPVAALDDPRGRNPKDRPAVVVTPTDEIDETGSVETVAITTILPDPSTDDHVLLPWQRPDHPRAGLNKRCAAVIP